MGSSHAWSKWEKQTSSVKLKWEKQNHGLYKTKKKKKEKEKEKMKVGGIGVLSIQ